MTHRIVSAPEPAALVADEQVFTVAELPAQAEFRLRLLARCAVVTSCGEVDLATAPALREAMLTGLAHSPRMVADMSQTRFLDTTGLHVLITALKHAHDNGGCLILVGPTGMVRKVLHATRLDELFTIRRNLDVAVAEATE
jgi:anti-sigma B factor antagonist